MHNYRDLNDSHGLSRLVGKIVRPSQLALDKPTLVNYDFHDCVLIGPAILCPNEDIEISDCSFNGDMEAMIWEIPEDKPFVIGAIELISCRFHRCIFEGIGFAGKPDFIEKLREGTTAGERD